MNDEEKSENEIRKNDKKIKNKKRIKKQRSMPRTGHYSESKTADRALKVRVIHDTTIDSWVNKCTFKSTKGIADFEFQKLKYGGPQVHQDYIASTVFRLPQVQQKLVCHSMGNSSASEKAAASQVFSFTGARFGSACQGDVHSKPPSQSEDTQPWMYKILFDSVNINSAD